MRILLAIPSLRCGGSERVMSILANHWAEAGHEVSLATFESPKSDFFELDPRVTRYVVGGSADAGIGWLGANRRRLAAMRAAIVESQADVVLSFLYTMNLLAIWAARGVAAVVVAERTDPRHRQIERWQAVLRRILYPRASAIVVQTNEVLEGWARDIASTARVCAIPNPVLPPEPSGPFGGWPEGPIVASAGRLNRHKGFDILVAAFSRAAADRREWSLVILGDGAEREALAAQAVRCGVSDRVSMPGTGDTASLFARAEVFATASRLEGFPNVLLEAMAAELAVVATDCPSGPREIVTDGVDGYLVPVDDVDRLAARLEQLMDDEALRRRCGQRAGAVLDRFRLERVAGRWERLFTEIQSRAL